MIVVVGSPNVDMVAMVEQLPNVGETVLSYSLVRAHGGKGGNQAVAAARLGARTAMPTSDEVHKLLEETS